MFCPFLNADPAFSAGPNMVVPIKDNDFDFFQSSSRMPIECSFGILVRRWGILWRPLTMRFDKRAPVISACMNLHNFCINERVSADIPPEGPNGTRQVQPDDGRGVRFVRYPTFDDKGRPVWYLDRDHEPAAAAAAGDVGPTPTAANPTELLKGRLAEKNLKAPSGPRVAGTGDLKINHEPPRYTSQNPARIHSDSAPRRPIVDNHDAVIT